MKSEIELFQRGLLSEDLSLFVGHWILERTPYIFDKNLNAYSKWRHLLAKGLNIDACDIIIIGSASTGFSLSPYKNYKWFDLNSDVDVAIISQYYFDISWQFLRGLGSERYSFTNTEQDSVKEHTNRLIYWGTVAADRLLPRLPFGTQWMEVLEKMSRESPVDGRKINVRLYKDFTALRAYQTDSITKLRNDIINS